MAENPIRKEDIIDGEAIRSEIQGLLGDLLKLAAVLQKDIVVSASEAKASLEKIDITTKEGRLKVRDINKEVVGLTKSYNDVTRAMSNLEKQSKKVNEEVKIEAGSYYDLNEQLKRLDRQIKSTADEGLKRQLGPQITSLRGKLKDFDGVLGVHTRNVGNYGKSIIEAGKQMLNFGGATAIVMMAVNKLKDAFTSTTSGMNIMNSVTQISKQAFYDLATSFQLNISNMMKAAETAAQMNDIRQGDIIDIIRIAKLERELNDLRIEEAKIVNDDAKKLEWRNKALAKEDELIKYKVDDLTQELTVIADLMEKRPKDEKLQLEFANKYAALQGVLSDRSVRLQQRTTAATEKQMEADKKRADNLQKYYDEIDENIRKEGESRAKEAADQEARNAKELEDLKEKNGFITQANTDHLLEVKDKNNKIQESNIQTSTKDKDQWKEDAETYLEIGESITSAYANILERRKQKELSAAGDNAAMREKIEREYANKEKAISISKSIINGAQGITKTFAELGFTPAAWVASALLAATTATQIAIIGAQKFAEGGYTGDGSFKDDTGERVAGVVHEKEYVIPKEQTGKYRGLLEAIHKDNPMAIADELRSRNFHTVWGGVKADLSTIQKQDPYTRMIYELMRNDVKIYTDSNGDTVIRYPDGRKQIIRHFE